MFASMRQSFWLCLPALLACATMSPGQTDKETPAEKIRKVLDQPITLNFSGQDLQDVASHLRDKTGVQFVIDPAANQFGLQNIVPFGQPPAAAPFELKADRTKLRTALRNFLNTQHLTCVILENSVLITTEDLAVTRQMTQRINVRVDEVPLQKALKDLMRSTPLNLVLDPRVIKEAAQNQVSLNLDDVTVETAVRLLAELGGLKSVRIDNVLFVTNEARADKMRKEQPPVKIPTNPMFPGVFGGAGIGIPRIIQAVPIPPPPAPEKKVPPALPK